MTAYDVLFRRVLTRTDPERAHRLAFRAIRAAGPPLSGGKRLVEWGKSDRRKGDFCVRAMGLTFPNPLGLAAGFDKNAVGIDALGALGFGHVEIGTVTGEPQPGNPRPRLFRMPEDRAVVNRMGFNNDGAEVVARRLQRRRTKITQSSDTNPPLDGQKSPTQRVGPVLGVNIGKSKVVPEDDAVRDYEKSARMLAPYADYLVVNVSSPNTPGLRNLQAIEKLEPVLTAVRATADDVTTSHLPLLVKIAPDLDDDDVLAIGDLALALGLDGIIATNTTISRDGLATDTATVEAIGAGGLSGAPLRARSEEVLRLLRGRVGPELTLIGVGGISTVEDARVRLEAGATLLQAYTGFVYEGPLWPRRILRGLAEATP
jgi:dihydroorotate dehydrogenase